MIDSGLVALIVSVLKIYSRRQRLICFPVGNTLIISQVINKICCKSAVPLALVVIVCLFDELRDLLFVYIYRQYTFSRLVVGERLGYVKYIYEIHIVLRL